MILLLENSAFHVAMLEIEATKKIKIIAENTRKVLVEKYIRMPIWYFGSQK